MSKTTTILLRVSPKEKADYEAAARADGLKLSAWIRRQCNREPEGGESPAELPPSRSVRVVVDGEPTVAPKMVETANEKWPGYGPDEKPKKCADGLRPPCSRCLRFGYTYERRNMNCPDCGREVE